MKDISEIRVLIVAVADSDWVTTTTAALDGVMPYEVCSDPQAAAELVARADVCLIHAHGCDPLVVAAHVWNVDAHMSIVLAADEVDDDTRSAAVEAGVAFVTRATPDPAELRTVLQMACLQNRTGSPELLRGMCRAMCKLSSVVASASDKGFIEAVVGEIRALFQADVVSVQLVGADGHLRVVGHTGLPDEAVREPRRGGISERVLRSGQAQITLRAVRREEALPPPRVEISASICVPILASRMAGGPQARGVVNIARTRPRSIFTPRDLEVAQSIAGLISDALSGIEARQHSAALEQRMAAVERLSTVGELAAGIAHEVANPVAAVRANFDAIIRYVTEIAPALREVEELRPELADVLDDLPSLLCETWEGLSRADDVVRQVKALVRQNGPARSDERVPLRCVARSTLRLLGSRLPSVDVDLHDDAIVLGSHVELSQVLVNLLVNAADACEERRQAEASGSYVPVVRVTTQRRGDQVVLIVEDNGAGIPESALGRIFMPLYTTKTNERGTGLGLSIVRRLVDRHSGVVRVASEVGVGTRFTIAFPVAPAPVEGENAHQHPTVCAPAERRAI